MESALNQGGAGSGFGRAYLEKIVQYPFDLPAAPRERLIEELEEAVNAAAVRLPGGGLRREDGLVSDAESPDRPGGGRRRETVD